MKYGLDYIGGVNYINAIRNGHPDGFAAGFLCRASGWKNGIRAARALAKTGRCPVMRIHGVWRDDHNFTEKHISIAVKQAEKVAKLVELYPGIKFYYSPWLEHRANLRLFRKCARACKKVLPKKVKIVSSGLVRPRGIDEVHHAGPLPGKYIFSFDGKDMCKSNIGYWRNIHYRALLFYGWTPKLNGKKSMSDKTERSKRSYYPKAREIAEYRRLIQGN